MPISDSNDKVSNEGHTGKKFCQYYSTCGHTTDQCTTLKALVKQVKEKRSKHFNKKKRFTKREVNTMVLKHLKKALKQKKRKPNEKVHAFKKMSVSDSDKGSISGSSSKEREV